MNTDALLRRIPLKRFRNPPPVVAVLRLAGMIGGGGRLRPGLNMSTMAGPIEAAFKLKHLKAVALAINSPGGSPVQSSLIARRIRALAEEKEVPVIAFVEDVAASGGYWLACAADEIYVDEASIIGSIGVVSGGFGFDEWIREHRISRRVYTAGARKGMLDPFRAEDAEDVARLQRVLDEIHETFKDHVRSRRGERLKGDENTLFSGEFWTGREGIALGLADGTGEIRSVLRARYGDDVRLRRVGVRQSRLKRLLGIGPVTDPRAWTDAVVDAIEERTAWRRFGL